MPFCPQCGVDNPSGARFCDQCGAMLVPVTAAPAPAATQAAAAPAPSTGGSVVCPQCGTAALPGEAFCDNCGAPLSAPARPGAPAPTLPGAVPPPASYPPPQPAAPPSYGQPSVPTLPPSAYTPPPTPAPAPAPASGGYRAALAPANLTVAATGAVIALPNAVQATIGRADPVSGFFPEVDLTPHGALDNGVGRRHARLFVQSGQVLLEDLDSTNGTKVNGQKLAPRRPQALRSGDEVTLGSMTLRFSEF